MKITLIAGLPGSGKTTLASQMREAGALVLDDFGVGSSLRDLPARLSQDLVITDVNFCHWSTLQTAKWQLSERYGVTPEIVYFQNDPEACLANVERRTDGREVGATIREFTKVYDPPADALPVWRG